MLYKNSSTNIKLLKTQMYRTIKSDGFLEPFIKVHLSSMKNMITPLAKSVLIPLRLIAVAADSAIHKNFLVLEQHQ